MKAFQKELHLFEKHDAQVLGVSSDAVATHEEFSAGNGLDFPLISDDKGELQGVYGPARVTFIIDRSGVIRFIHRGVPRSDQLLEELAKLQ